MAVVEMYIPEYSSYIRTYSNTVKLAHIHIYIPEYLCIFLIQLNRSTESQSWQRLALLLCHSANSDPLDWVVEIVKSNTNIYFTDRECRCNTYIVVFVVKVLVDV